MAFGAMLSDPGWPFLRLTDDEMNQLTSKPFDSKKNVWIPDAEEGFITAEIKATKGDQVTVITSRMDEKTLKKDAVQQMNPPKFENTEDMSNLTILNEGCVLHNLRSRYASLMIYTYSGLFCVVINPYKRLPIYTPSVVKMFQGKRRNEMPPHLFAVADQAFRNMNIDRENQSMLITGESGAGKTENTKKVISYLALVGCSTKDENDPSLFDASGKKKATLEEQIVQTNPVLEAFGNAKTVRNNNSSRFGKFIRSHFNRDAKLAGGDIEHYLLEKSRAIKQNPGERCYHIFYQICSEFVKGLKEKTCLLDLPVGDYTFVNQGELTIEGVDDKEENGLTEEAFDIMGYSQREKTELYTMVASNMHAGNMKFKQRPREEQAEADGTDECEKASKLWGVEAEDYMKAILKPRVKVGTEWVNKGQNLEQVKWSVGAMGKGLYDRTFTWIVKRCNKTLDATVLKREYFIGVLDIAGFEIFDYNSFEQLWINFVNEKLQQFFNHHMFVLEQEEYGREGIPWTVIDFGMDLAACIELIEKPLGVISMMDEECIVPKATDLTLAQKLADQHLGKHPNFQKPRPPKGKQAEAHFALVHYAGTVRYNVTAWLEKNKDPLNDTCVSVMKGSKTNELLGMVWKSYTTQEEAMEAAKRDGGGGARKKGKSGAFMTVSMIYREGLNNLMHMLHQTHPHFIRCIIPNELKRSGMLDAALVLHQLTCNGVLEGIRICRKGFPNRLLFPDFKQRYSVLAPGPSKAGGDDPKASSVGIIQALIKEGQCSEETAKIGNTKVFFKAGILAHLEDLRDAAIAAILTSLQAQIRWWLARKEMIIRKEQRAGLLIVQRNVRSWCTLRNWPWFKLYAQVRPMLKAGKIQEEMDALAAALKETQEKLAKEEKLRKEMEESNAKLLIDKNDLFSQLNNSSSAGADMEERNQKLDAIKKDLEKQLAELNDRLAEQEDRTSDVGKAKKKVEQEVENAKRTIQDLEMSIRKQESEKQAKDHQIKSLQDEMGQQDEGVSKLNKEKKHQEEVNRKLTEDLQAEEDKVNHLNKVKAKLENTLDELEDGLEREKRVRQDVEKSKRKTEGELKIANENIDELNRIKHDLEGNVKKKEQEIVALNARLEDEQSLVAKLQRQIKELQARVAELEEELESERAARSKAEKGKQDLQRELEEINDRLEEAGGATAAQIESNKKREAELGKLRRDLEESNLNHEAQIGGLRKKHNDAVAEMGEQLEQLQKQKAKIEKDKSVVQREVEDLHAAVDQEVKAKQNQEKTAKTLELQNAELQSKCDEQTRQLADYDNMKKRLGTENSELVRQLEDAESQVNLLNRMKQQLSSQLEEAKRNLDEEARERQSALSQLRNFQHEADTLRDQLDEESEGKAEIQRQLSKANAEIQQWRAKFDSEGLARADEIEEGKRKLMAKIAELQDQVNTSNQRMNTMEKNRHRMQAELEDAQVEAERANGFAMALDKKQKGFDKIIDDWKRKCDDLAAELDASQRESRNLSTEVFKSKSSLDELSEQMEALRRENRSLAQEIKDLADQLGEGGRSVHELQKMRRRLELEKEELQAALDEAEAALEAEESKVLRAQVEVSQIRQEIEKRIHEKEEEFENTRKNHQRTLESMQASLESESKGRQELLRMKKKLEQDINELEIALDHANKANADAQKNMKRYQDQIRELQMQVEEEQRSRDEIREQYNTVEKRCNILQSEKDEAHSSAANADRARRQAEADASDFREQVNDLSAQNASLNATKRKIEGEMQALHSEMDDALQELKVADDKAKVAMMDAAKLADELRQEQEHAQHVERQRKGLELQIKEMGGRLEEAEAAALKGGKKTIQKLEGRVRELEADLDQEGRRHQDTMKNLRKQERIAKELQFQVDEDKKSMERQQELTEQLMNKIKVYKRQIDDAEQLAGSNLQKYRQLQVQLEDAEERADVAENSLSKMRMKSRSSASVMPSASGLMSSPSGMMRSGSRARSTANDF